MSRFFHTGVCCLFLLIISFFFKACGYESQVPARISEQPETVVMTKVMTKVITRFEGYDIPQFQTAKAHLDYAGSLVSDSRHKAAVLKFLLSRFPESRKETGRAAMELAYLGLGDDYRLAGRKECENALAAYEKIMTLYSDFPEICAKTCWYMGWIYTDLLNDRKRGIRMYLKVRELYPKQSIKAVSPVPWLPLVSGDEGRKNPVVNRKKPFTWDSLALLEIVKNSRKTDQRFSALALLRKDYPESLPTGFALLSLLADMPVNQNLSVNQNLKDAALAYIKVNKANLRLNNDIASILSNARYPKGF